MTIPSYKDFLLPLLRFSSDGRQHSLSESIEYLIREFNFNESEIKELQSNGRQTKLSNRVGWASFYLRKANLIYSISHGKFQITERGKAVITSSPPIIDHKFLKQFPEYKMFRYSCSKKSQDAKDEPVSE